VRSQAQFISEIARMKLNGECEECGATCGVTIYRPDGADAIATLENRIREARLIVAAPELADALEALCDGACWSLGGPRSHIAEIPAAKIEAARAALQKAGRV